MKVVSRHQRQCSRRCRVMKSHSILLRLLIVAVLAVPAGQALAQFYKDNTLTLLVNYGVGGNADTEARVYRTASRQIHSRSSDDHHPQHAGRRRRDRNEPARAQYRLAAGWADDGLFHHERHRHDDRRSGAQDQDRRSGAGRRRAKPGTSSTRARILFPAATPSLPTSRARRTFSPAVTAARRRKIPDCGSCSRS